MTSTPALPAEIAGLDAADLLCRLGVDAEYVQAVFVAGSLVQGWGNVDSDLDVYLICTRPTTPAAFTDVHTTRLSSPEVPVGGLPALGRDCDIEVWTGAQVEELLAQLSPERRARSSSMLEGFSHFELDFLEKVSYGIPLSGTRAVERIQRAVRDSVWQDSLISRALDLSDIYLTDALGQLDSGDTVSAVLSGKLAFGYSVDAVACAAGQYGRSPKWRGRRLCQIDSPLLPFEVYWSVETMAGYDDRDRGRWVLGVVALCRKISATIPVAS
jgi:hypothetical protein